MRRTFLHRALSAACIAALATLAAAPPGCASRDSISITQERYDGPPIELTTAGGQQIVKLTAPTGGWNFRLDTTRPQMDTTEVFVTAKRPNPAFMQTQALVTHELATGVAPEKPIRLYARVLEHDEESGAYRPVPLGFEGGQR